MKLAKDFSKQSQGTPSRLVMVPIDGRVRFSKQRGLSFTN